MQHLRWAGTMDSSSVCSMKLDVIPSIPDVLLRKILEPPKIAFLDELLDLVLLLVRVGLPGVVSLGGGALTVPAYLLDVACPDPVLSTKSVRLLCVTLDKRHKNDELDVLVQLALVNKVPNEPGALQFHEAFQYGGQYGVEILSLDLPFLIMIFQFFVTRSRIRLVSRVTFPVNKHHVLSLKVPGFFEYLLASGPLLPNLGHPTKFSPSVLLVSGLTCVYPKR